MISAAWGVVTMYKISHFQVLSLSSPESVESRGEKYTRLRERSQVKNFAIPLSLDFIRSYQSKKVFRMVRDRVIRITGFAEPNEYKHFISVVTRTGTQASRAEAPVQTHKRGDCMRVAHCGLTRTRVTPISSQISQPAPGFFVRRVRFLLHLFRHTPIIDNTCRPPSLHKQEIPPWQSR
jgi:hypothetical protein